MNPELVDQAVALLRRGDAVRFFFDKLTSSKWIAPLLERGLFESPPEPIRHEDQGTIQFPIWAASRFLVRVAAENPAAVLAAIEEIPDTENPRIYEDFADAGVVMPGELARRVAWKVEVGLDLAHQMLLPRKAAALAVHLAEEGESDAAMSLLARLLKIQKPVTGAEDESGARGLSFEAKSNIDAWDYRSVLTDSVPALVESLGQEVLSLLCDVLEEAIDLEGEERARDDASWIWRPAIEDHEQNMDREIKSFLVSAIRDAALSLAGRSSDDLEVVLKTLGRDRFVFQRLRLFLLAEMAPSYPERVSEALLDGGLRDTPQVAHEYGRLLGAGFALLGEAEQGRILEWVERGPDTTGAMERYEQETGEPAPEDLVRRRREYWQLAKLSLIGRDPLPADWQDEFDRLQAAHGPAPGEDFPFSIHTSVGESSPVEMEDLNTMTPLQVVNYLASWEPSGEFLGPTREGLGTTLQLAVKAQSQLYSQAAEAFRDLDPIYVRSLIRGLEQAVSSGDEIDWGPVVSLCEWVLEQPREIPDRVEEYSDIDPGWVWARAAMADLLREGLSAEGRVPIELRDRVWVLIAELLADPEPVEIEGWDRPEEVSLNTIRGKAVHAAFSYGWWVNRSLDPESHDRRMTAMPELAGAFDGLLDPASEPNPAVRSVFGWRFGLLAGLDRGWAEKHRDAIFSRTEAGFDALGRAALEAYLRFSRALGYMVDVLRPVYMAAIGELDPEADLAIDARDWRANLADHLVALLWGGAIAEDDSLMRELFERAPPKTRGRAIEMMGRILRDATEPDEDALARAQSLWEHRLEVVLGQDWELAAKREELQEFGWWFTSKVVAAEWKVAQLTAVLTEVGWAEPDDPVIEELLALAEGYPLEVTKAAAVMVKTDLNGWGVYAWRHELHALLGAVLASGNADAEAAAKDLVDEMLVRGYEEFRSLVSGGEGDD